LLGIITLPDIKSKMIDPPLAERKRRKKRRRERERERERERGGGGERKRKAGKKVGKRRSLGG